LAAFRLRVLAVGARNDREWCDQLLSWMPAVLASGRDDAESGGVALLSQLRTCASEPALQRASLAALTIEHTPALPTRSSREWMLESCFDEQRSTRWCTSLPLLASRAFHDPCAPQVIELAHRLGESAERRWIFASLGLLDACGAQRDLAALVSRLRSSSEWRNEPVLTRLSAPAH
jgi:hypothetical protein